MLPEISDWFGKEPREAQVAMDSGLRVIHNVLHGVQVEPDLDTLGFLIRETGSRWTQWALWRRTDGLWSSSVCIPDVAKGIDIEDEKSLADGVGLDRAVAKIRADHLRTRPDLYPRVIDPSEGVLRKWGRTPCGSM